MNDHLVKFTTSFIVGTVATAGLARLIQWAPIPSYMKFVLAVVVRHSLLADSTLVAATFPEQQPQQHEILISSSQLLLTAATRIAIF